MAKDLTNNLILLQQTLGEDRFKLNQNLDEFVVTQSGVVAEGFTVASTLVELERILELVNQLRLPFVVIGAGTKILTSGKVFKGLVIKNRAANMKIIAFKGKFGKGEIGIEEATVEVDSGASLGKLNEYLANQGLEQLVFESDPRASLGGAVFSDHKLRPQIEKLRVWQHGDVAEVEVHELRRLSDVVVNVIFKLKAAFEDD